jgi:hypothetical protein
VLLLAHSNSGSSDGAAWWTPFSAAGAPVFLIGGWTLAAALQPRGFDSFKDTISALAGLGAQDRWLMTTALYALGVCHVLTAWGLRAAGIWGRRVLGFGGVCTLFVASLPLPSSPHGDASGHLRAATAAFVSLTVWPLFAFRRDPDAPPGLGPQISVAASLVLIALLGWLGYEVRDRTYIGLAERMAAGAQGLWPLVVVLATTRSPRH